MCRSDTKKKYNESRKQHANPVSDKNVVTRKREKYQEIYFAPSRRTVPNNCKDNTFSFWTQSSGSNLRMYKASNTARCNKDLPRDKTENTPSEYHSRQLALPDRWHLIAEVPFPWPDDLAVVTSDIAACESLPLRPASLQFGLPRSRSVCCPTSSLSCFRGLPRFFTLTVVVTSSIGSFDSSSIRLLNWLLVTRPGLDCPDVSFGGFRIGLFFLLTVVWAGSSPPPDEKEEASASVSTADLDKSTSDMDCTGHFGGRPRRGREPRAATGTRFNGTCWRIRAPRCWKVLPMYRFSQFRHWKK